MRNIDWVNVLIWLVVMPIGSLLSWYGLWLFAWWLWRLVE